MREAVAAQPGERVLDIAAGTGTSSEPFADAGVDVVPADFSLGMLRVGNRRRPDLAFTAADAMRLPFADDSFDAVTMSFGLRNVADPDAGPARVPAGDAAGRPAGRLRVQPPTNAAFRKVYAEYLMRSLPALARRVSSNPDSYVYLAESIQAWPAQRELAPWSGPPAGPTWSGATSPAASWPCTAPSRPPERRTAARPPTVPIP